MKIKNRLNALLICVLLVVAACQSDHQEWAVYIPAHCSFSSPRPLDLNGDGVLDLVMGVGKGEFIRTDTAIIAVDGSTGALLWHAPAHDQMVGSPVFLEINGDGVEDVVLGGRAGELQALSGKTGKQLWSYYSEEDFAQKGDSVFLNFYTPQIIDDVNGDGLGELLVSMGGDATIPRYEPNRPPGKLMVLDSRTGQELVGAHMPDSLETFMSPLCVDLEGDGGKTVFFGTGGEIYGGYFYRIPLKTLLETGSLASAARLLDGRKRGFIGPPVVADINQDEVLDIVVNAVDGRIIALDGKSNETLWQVEIPNMEVYSSLAVGNFTGDDTPDFFTNFGDGIFPEIENSIQVLVDGGKGQIVFQQQLGFLQIGSPLAGDFNNDGYDDALMSVNRVDKSMNKNHYNSLFGTTNALLLFDFQKEETYRIMGTYKGINPAATPYVGDLDGDGRIDIVYTYISDTVTYKPFNGMMVHRKEFDYRVDGKISWGSYMGTQYDGIYRP